MSLPELDNLVRIGQLKAEPRNELELKRMLEMARTRLADAQLDSLSLEGRFASAYNAAIPRLWPHCAGMAIAAKTGTPFFFVLPIPWAGPPVAGGCWMPRTRKEIWRNMRATWRLRSRPSRICARWCPA